MEVRRLNRRRGISQDGTLANDGSTGEQLSERTTLGELRPGAVFVTKDGVLAVKSEYRYGNEPGSQCQCVLLASGEYAHFAAKNETEVREIFVED
jgi:hypothetical protein